MKHALIGLSLALGLALGTPAFAAGESSGSGSGTTTTPSNGSNKSDASSPKKLDCKKDEVVKTITKDGKKIKACVKVSAGILPDEELYQQGRLLAKAGEYDWALTVLAAIKNQNDPRVLNYMGYSNRKAGRLETGISYYRKALALNPNFVLAREYLGEGYVAAGLIDQAKVQLKEIETRCGVKCDEYIDLKKAIETGVN